MFASKRSKIESRMIAVCTSGCAILILVMVIVGISATQGSLRAVTQSGRIASQFLQYLGDNDLLRANALTSAGFQRRSSLATLRKWAGSYRTATGTVTKITAQGKWIWTGSHVSLVYYVQGSQAVQQASFILSQTASGYKIDSCDFTVRPSMSSPVLMNRR